MKPQLLRVTGAGDGALELQDPQGQTFRLEASAELIIVAAGELAGPREGRPPAPARQAPAPTTSEAPNPTPKTPTTVMAPAPAKLPVGAAPPVAAPAPAKTAPTASAGTPSTPWEKSMDTQLRPRDIQARVRAGEEPESLAEAAGMPLTRVLIYANPVLAERAHVARTAQAATIRFEGSNGVLGDLVRRQLHAAGFEEDVVNWDAWRRPDGKWSLRGTCEIDTLRVAEFCYDQPGRYVVLENADAQWLTGLGSSGAFDADLRAIGVLRESARVVTAGELAAQTVAETAAPELGVELPEDAPAERNAESPAELAEGPAARGVSQEDTVLPLAELDDEPVSVAKRPRGRASVPSWDEIMFGNPEGS